MPNWCENKVTISSQDENLIKQIGKELKEDFSEVVNGKTVTGTVLFSFQKLLPMPEEIRNTNSPNHIVATEKEAAAYNEEHKGEIFFRPAQTQAQVDAIQEKYGVTNWYDWAVKNWGTKWDLNADSVHVVLEDELIYTFNTAWGPPVGIYHALVAKYPDAHISWFYNEPGMEFAGYLNKEEA